MKTIKVLAEITYEEEEIIADATDPDDIEWLHFLIHGDDNIIWNNKIGDEFGTLKVLEIC